MDRHIKDVLKHYLNKGKISRGFTTEKIKKVWKETMGAAVDGQTSTIKYYDGELVISITSSVLKYELFQNSKRIIEVLNEKLNTDAIQSIRFA